ncbi:MAG: hypothetical protein K2P86_14775 [Xanthobacteraceae bacterium]|nr:hypothetical protein [Xanthobacteraceae bacterium]
MKVVGSRVAGNTCRAAALAAALAVGGCASGDVPVPFMDLSMPSIPVIPLSNPAANPANTPETFPAIAPPADRDEDQPVMNDVERIKLEQELRKMSTEREAQVKQRILRAN